MAYKRTSDTDNIREALQYLEDAHALANVLFGSWPDQPNFRQYEGTLLRLRDQIDGARDVLENGY